MEKDLKGKIADVQKKRKQAEKDRMSLIKNLKETILDAVQTYQTEDTELINDESQLRSLQHSYERALQNTKDLNKEINRLDKQFAVYGEIGERGPQGPQGPRGVQGEPGIVGWHNSLTKSQLIRDEEKRLLREITLNRLVGELIQFVTNEHYVGERLEERIYRSDK